MRRAFPRRASANRSKEKRPRHEPRASSVAVSDGLDVPPRAGVDVERADYVPRTDVDAVRDDEGRALIPERVVVRVPQREREARAEALVELVRERRRPA